MTNTTIEKFNLQCTDYFKHHLASSSVVLTDKVTSEHLLTDYKRSTDEQKNFVDYINDQLAPLEALKSCENTMDTFLQRLKKIHEYEFRQKELFEQILQQLIRPNPSNPEERLQLFHQIDQLIADKAKLTDISDES